MQVPPDAIDQRVRRLGNGRRRSGRSALFEFRASIGDGDPDLFDRGRIRKDELTERGAGDLQQL